MEKLVLVSEALEELGLEEEDFREFIGDLKDFLQDALPELSAAVADKNALEIRAKAHAIKGALANLRFVAGAKIAHELEMKGRDGVTEGLEPLVSDLESTLAASYAEIGA